MAVALAFAVWRPRGLPEATVAIPAAVLAVVIGAVTLDRAFAEMRELTSTVIILAALLVLSHACGVLGVFRWLSQVIGTAGSANGGGPVRLFALAFGGAALTTALLNLDATVVLLTPVLITMARSLQVSPRPMGYATIGLANSASTLMPVSNLTNLLAFAATGLGFIQFTAMMALPWLVTVLIEFAIYRVFFRDDLRVAPQRSTEEPVRAPIWALVVLGATLVGFALSSTVGVEPVWFAVAGAIVLSATAMRAHRTTLRAVASATTPLFLLFVLALGVLVAAIADGGIGRWVGEIVPTGSGIVSLLTVAAIGAVAANLINNIPATLLLLAALGTHADPPLILAMLLGVNIGSNLTYVGSLANLLWRNVSRSHDAEASVARFSALGLLTVPPAIVASVTALWLVT
ncbi:SLC13 family permease [Williamsia sp.]|uniref:SLC13 family permease n=1 Tax=Williamsia sp. TaxID=1872085 RepID=UPI001A1CA2C1|nr:SLC13 family permease [Williamsia sp.]MBJ7289435.1 arsenic transporter [Williamsia sp.]